MFQPLLEPSRILRNLTVGATSTLPLRATAITDVGLVRRQNEDRFVCEPQWNVFGVADGVGGLPGGARAAEAAVRTVRQFAESETLASEEAWKAPVHAAHENVLEVGRIHSPSYGVASTLTCGSIEKETLILAHIGDSRCVLLREGASATLTEDHSAENEHKRDPSTPEPAPRWRGALARCLGQPDALRPVFASHQLLPGDVVCFATDGITRLLGVEELDQLLRQTAAPAPERLTKLIDLTYERGAPDNATLVMVEVLADMPKP